MNLSSPQRRLISETDIERRRIERQLATGDPQARARLLAQRIRSGELSKKNVTIAAALGDPAAKQLGLKEPYIHPTNLNYWFGAIKNSNLTIDQVANWAADCIEKIIPIYEKEWPEDLDPKQIIQAVRARDKNTLRDLHWEVLRIKRRPFPMRSGSWAALFALSWLIGKQTNPGVGTISQYLHAVSGAIRAGLSIDWATKRLIQYLLD